MSGAVPIWRCTAACISALYAHLCNGTKSIFWEVGAPKACGLHRKFSKNSCKPSNAVLGKVSAYSTHIRVVKMAIRTSWNNERALCRGLYLNMCFVRRRVKWSHTSLVSIQTTCTSHAQLQMFVNGVMSAEIFVPPQQCLLVWEHKCTRQF